MSIYVDQSLEEYIRTTWWNIYLDEVYLGVGTLRGRAVWMIQRGGDDTAKTFRRIRGWVK